MNLVKMTRHDGHKVDVHPNMIDDYKTGGYRVDDNQSDAEDVPQPKAEASETPVGEGNVLTDDALRDEIERLTGKRPHHKTGREKLEKMLDESQG